MEVVAYKIHFNAKLLKFFRYHPEIAYARVFYCDITLGHRRKANKRTYFESCRVTTDGLFRQDN